MDFKDFKIDINYLENYKSPTWNEDDLYFSDDENFAVYFYNINEFRMLCYASEFAIFEKNNPIPIFNFKKNFVWYLLKTPMKYLNKSECFVFKRMIGKQFPYLFIKPKEKQFSFLKFDWNSIYFDLNEIEKDELELHAQNSKEIERLNLQYLQNGKISLSNLNWFDFKEFGNFENIYKK